MDSTLQKILEVVLTILIALIASFISSLIVKSIFKKIIDGAKHSQTKKQITTLRGLIISLINVGISLFALMLVLAEFGISLKHLAATAGVMGVAIGFGAKRSIEDIIIGASILLNGQIMVGDSVKIAGISGVVEKINLKLIALRDAEGTVHYIRNSMVDIISNYSKDYSYAVFDLPLGFKTNIADVVNIIQEVGSELIKDKSSKMLEAPEIFGIDRFENGAVILKFRVKSKPGHQSTLKRAFNASLKDRLVAADIELNFGTEVIVKNT